MQERFFESEPHDLPNGGRRHTDLPEQPLRPISDGAGITADEEPDDHGYPPYEGSYGTGGDPADQTKSEDTDPAGETPPPTEPPAETPAASGENPEDRGFLGFRQKFDGAQPEVPHEEQVRVAADFVEYLGGVYERIDSPVYAYDPNEPEKQSITQVSLDGGDARIEVVINDERQDAAITITAVVDGVDDESVYYELQEDGVVRRYDQPVSEDERARRRLTRDPDAWGSREEALFSMIQTTNAALAAHAAKDTEEILGLNGQPISAREFAALRQAIDEALARKAAEEA